MGEEIIGWQNILLAENACLHTINMSYEWDMWLIFQEVPMGDGILPREYVAYTARFLVYRYDFLLIQLLLK